MSKYGTFEYGTGVLYDYSPFCVSMSKKEQICNLYKSQMQPNISMSQMYINFSKAVICDE